MKKYIIVLILFLCLPYCLKGQLKYYDAVRFPLYGKIAGNINNIENHYVRLPDSLQHIFRKPVWNLSRNTAGLSVRFRSNSTTIAVKWEVLNNHLMNHMTPTATKGLDLYAWVDGSWRFVNSARPVGKVNQATVIANMDQVEREYMLYLPLYDGVVSLSIGVDDKAFVEEPRMPIPIRTKPVVCYGTSILQGGCASRSGMAHTNIISRRLNREVINLGFGGNAFLDYEIAEVMSSVDAGAYILDFVPNASAEQIFEKMEKFYRILRDKHPHTPILFVEDPVFPHAQFDKKVAFSIANKNKMLNMVFELLKKKGEKNIYMVSSEKMLGEDGEATIDGIHFTDLGMMRYVGLIYPIVNKVLINN